MQFFLADLAASELFEVNGLASDQIEQTAIEFERAAFVGHRFAQDGFDRVIVRLLDFGNALFGVAAKAVRISPTC